MNRTSESPVVPTLTHEELRTRAARAAVNAGEEKARIGYDPPKVAASVTNTMRGGPAVKTRSGTSVGSGAV